MDEAEAGRHGEAGAGGGAGVVGRASQTGEAVGTGPMAAGLGVADAAGGEGGQAPNELEVFLAGMLANSTGMTEELLRENGMQLPGEEPPARERPLLPEEAQLVAERAAVQAALDEVRRENRADRLATPALWRQAGCAPAHMDDDAFAAFVFDCLDAAQAGEEFAGSGMEPDPALYPDPRAAGEEDADGGDDGATSEDAGEGASENDAACEDADAGASEDAGEGPAPADPAVQDVPASDALAADGAPTHASEDVPFVEPAVLEHVHDRLACDDIRVIEGAQDVYLYSTDLMSDNFAHWAQLSQEGDDAVTLVDTVREESRVYPRPMRATSLTNAPYGLALDRVYEVFEQVTASGDYPDIQRCEATNGDVYFYSTRYLSPAQAKALAQWYSVEKPMNV